MVCMGKISLVFVIAAMGISPVWPQGVDLEKEFAAAVTRAKAGDVAAQTDVGSAYLMGRGVAPDLEQAEQWFRKAAEQDSSTAQHQLGMICAEKSHGGKFPQFEKEAVQWWTKAAEQGNRKAAWQLGHAYAGGTGVAKNNVQAYKWLNLAVTRFGTEGARDDLENLAKLMTRDQIAEAQKLSAEFKARTREPQKTK